MKIGIPKEIKNHEKRVSLIPFGVEALVDDSHQVYVETQAGKGSGFEDADYEREFKKLKKGYYVVGYLGGLYEIISLKWRKKDKVWDGGDGDVKLKFVKNLAYKRGHKKKPRSSWDGKVVSWRDMADEQVAILTKEEDYDREYK